MKPTKDNLECADVIMERNNLDASRGWQALRRDIAIALTIAEHEAYKRGKREAKKGSTNE